MFCDVLYYLLGFRFLCAKALTRPAVAMIASPHEGPEDDYIDDKKK